MKILINYADDNFKKQQKRNSKTGIKYGGFDKVFEYGPEKLGDDFLEKHSSFISQNEKGGGYWLWKPYIILHTLLNKASEGDYVFYSDSGAIFINTINFLIKAMNESSQEILLTEIPLLEYQWTKRECFLKLDCLKEEFLYSNQVQAGFILIKVTKETIDFFQNYYDLCADYKLLTDENDININRDLKAHRHDQSILSLLAKKKGLKFFRDISQYGIRPWQYIGSDRDFSIKKYWNSSYPQIVQLYRKENWKKVLFREKVKDYLGVKLRY